MVQVDNVERAIEVCDMIAADSEADVAKWDGQPLTGHNVAVMHGEIMAYVHTLAQLLGALFRAIHEDGTQRQTDAEASKAWRERHTP